MSLECRLARTGASLSALIALAACASPDASDGGPAVTDMDAGDYDVSGGSSRDQVATSDSAADRGSAGDVSSEPPLGIADATTPIADTGGTAADSEGAVDSSADGLASGDAPTLPDCVTAGTELCDDFESGELDPSKWKINKTANDSVAVETGQAHSGKYAVHFKLVPGQTNRSVITEAVTFPAKSDAFYTRAFAYFAPDLPTGTGGNGYHTGLIYGSGRNNLGKVQAGLGSIGPKDFLGYSIYFGPPFYEFGPWAPSVTPNTWLCLELYESGSGGVEENRQVWVNDMEIPKLRSTYSGQQPPEFNLVSIGVYQYDGATPTLSDVWIDDVRVSAQRIGCGQ
jgi:hypothetical protein